MTATIATLDLTKMPQHLVSEMLMLNTKEPTITVYGPRELFEVDCIWQQDRFATYDERDLAWAVPLGLCSIGKRSMQVGDTALLSTFIHADADQLWDTVVRCGSIGIGIAGVTWAEFTPIKQIHRSAIRS